jgi:hypothetical protein
MSPVRYELGFLYPRRRHSSFLFCSCRFIGCMSQTSSKARCSIAIREVHNHRQTFTGHSHANSGTTESIHVPSVQKHFQLPSTVSYLQFVSHERLFSTSCSQQQADLNATVATRRHLNATGK